MNYNLFYSTTEHPLSTVTSELDFVQHWVEQTVEKEILRGKELQHLKEKTTIVKEYDVVNVDYGKVPFCEPSGSQSKPKKPSKKILKKRIHKLKKGKKNESLCTCRSPKFNRKRIVKNDCPMRIAELAVPTKRQCLQNWINNKNILPDFMIHRLQQIIRDQRPVVKISDAIICFKTRRSKRKCKSRCKKDDKKKCYAKTLKKAKNLADARVFCGVFAYRLIRILNRPMVIELSSELEKIARIVSMDIIGLLNKKPDDIRIIKKKPLLDEISSKITLWIWSILEGANDLILDDQLRELDEEIGPVLDIIDDLVDNVVDICYVESIHEETSSSDGNEGSKAEIDSTDGHSNLEKISDDINHESNKEIQPTDNQTDLDKISTDINTHITNEIVNSLIKNAIGDDDNDKFDDSMPDVPLHDSIPEVALDEKLSERLADKEFVDAEENNFPKPDIDPSEQIENLEERDEKRNQVSDDFNDADEDNFPKPDTDPSEQIENPEESDEERNQVSDDFNDADEDNFSKPDIDTSEQIENPEERDEERNQVSDDGKKVTFSQLNTVKKTNSIGTTGGENEDSNGKILNWKSSLQKIVFSEPNDCLLSDHDEIWPPDIVYENVVKSTLTVNKSVSSMGNIFETEEKASLSQTVDIFDQNKFHTSEQELGDFKIEDILTNENDDLNKNEFKVITESKAVQTSIDKSNLNNYRKLRDAGINTSPSSSTSGKRKKGKTVTSKSLADFTKKSTRPSFNYKVCPGTAPAWAMQGFYKSNEGSRHKKQINQCQIRKWCNDLQTGYSNLKLWGKWLDETSRMVTDLEKNKVKCCSSKRKQATKLMKFKKNIDDDADIWNKKHRCTRKQLAEYRELYRDNLVPKIYCKCSKKIATL